jgi:hypothetical protein
MTAQEAMELGMKIAEKHNKNVMQIYNMGAGIRGALDGCTVALAADIMAALQPGTSAESVRDANSD